MAGTNAPRTGGPTARALALRVLRDVHRHGAYSNRALAEHLERWPELDRRDRGLTTTLVYGVLRHQARLDAHLDAVARKPAGLKGEVRDTLRVGAFEILELQRPPAIAIAEASKLVMQKGGKPIAATVQAILAGVARDADARDDALGRGKGLDVLAGRWSIPRWIAGRWIKHLGENAALARARAVAEPPPVDVRVDTTRIRIDDAATRLADEHPGVRIERVDEAFGGALRLRGAGDLFYGPMHEEGLVSVQGLAAQQAVRMLAPEPGSRVLDACAGMGVKTLQLAEHMDRRGTIVAADADATPLSHVPALRQRGRLGDALDLQVVAADLSEHVPALDDAPFDLVLLDAPCTGLGNLGRHPEIRWLRAFDDIATRVELQRALLERCLRRTRPGGRLAYAVCSAEPEEGPQLVAEALADATATLEQERTFTPESDATEGFHVAIVRT